MCGVSKEWRCLNHHEWTGGNLEWVTWVTMSGPGGHHEWTGGVTMNGPGVTMNGPGVTISGSGGQCT